MFRYSDYIYEIYKEKSFTKASEKLFISQPALSATVKKAEDKLGVKIFDRSTAKLSLTEFGKEYIEAVEEIKKIEKNLRNRIDDISELNHGSITIGGAHFIASYILPEIILIYKKNYPNINIELIESYSHNLQEKIINEEIEIMIDYSFNELLCTGYPMAVENLLLAVPKGNKSALKYQSQAYTSPDIRNNLHINNEKKKISLNSFSEESFLLLKPGNDMNMIASMIFAETGFKPKVEIYLDQLMTAYSMSNAGLGISFVTDTLVKSVPPSDKLLFFSLTSEHTKRNLYIIHKKNKYIKCASQKFIETAIEKYGKKI